MALWEDGVVSCSVQSGKGPRLTHGSAGLQTLLLRDKVVAVAHAAAILERLTGHGRAVIEIPADHPEARTFGVGQLAGIWGGVERQRLLSASVQAGHIPGVISMSLHLCATREDYQLILEMTWRLRGKATCPGSHRAEVQHHVCWTPKSMLISLQNTGSYQ